MNQLPVEDLARNNGRSLDDHHFLGISNRQKNAKKDTMTMKYSN